MKKMRIAAGAWPYVAVAWILRMAVAMAAHRSFPPSEDGHYYDVLARRLADGHGYTWLWPDGAVTFAAHYPVGYPGLLAAGYVVFGKSVLVAMAVGATFGAAAAWGVYVLVDDAGGARWRPAAAALAIATHPALVPYTAALMTEGVTAALLVVAAGLAARARRSEGCGVRLVALGGVVALATLVRPQSLAFAPVVGFFAAGPAATARRRFARAVVVSAVALICVSPWTIRNCARMHRCALVSVNGGWNLLIGATTSSGGWAPVDVPPECATVWDEAGKDRCFEEAAWKRIHGAPGAWIAKAPAKIAMTFDYFGAAPWYLHASNPAAFDEGAKTALATVETITSRLFLLTALVACGRLEGKRRLARKIVALSGAVAAVGVHAWPAYLAVAACVGLVGYRDLVRSSPLPALTAAILLETMAIHGVFFGAGRYGLVIVPFVVAMAFIDAPRLLATGDESARGKAERPSGMRSGERVDVAL